MLFTLYMGIFIEISLDVSLSKLNGKKKQRAVCFLERNRAVILNSLLFKNLIFY